MRSLSVREIIIAITLLLMLIAWLLISLGKGYQQINDDLTEKQDMLIAKIQRQKQLIAEAPKMKEVLASLTNHFGVAASEGVETAAMVKVVEKEASVHNVHVVNIQPKRSTSSGQLKTFFIELTLDGQWAAIVDFIQSLQSGPHLLDIESMQLEKYSEATGSLRGVLVLKRWRVLSQN